MYESVSERRMAVTSRTMSRWRPGVGGGSLVEEEEEGEGESWGGLGLFDLGFLEGDNRGTAVRPQGPVAAKADSSLPVREERRRKALMRTSDSASALQASRSGVEPM